MLSWIVGNVDAPAACVLVAIVLGLCAIASTPIARWCTRAQTEQAHIDSERNFELAKIKQADDTKIRLAAQVNDRDFKMKQVESGMITSHARSSGSGTD